MLTVPLAALRGQNAPTPQAADIEATIRAAVAQKNHDALDQAARNLESMRQYEAAQKLLESALTIREETAGKESESYAAGLLKLGDLAVKRGQSAAAEDYYTPAIARGDLPEMAPALMYLANRALGVKNYDRADELAQRALKLSPTGSTAVHALVLEGNIKQAQDLAGAAESDYLRALGIAEANSPDAAYVMETYAVLMRAQARGGEADAMASSAAAIRSRHIAELSRRLNAQGVSQASSDSPSKVGNGVAPPHLIFKQEPQYSEEARIAKIQGTVVLTVTIGVNGRITQAALAKSVGFGLDEQALDAVTQWVFKPGARDGLPVPVMAQIEVNFRLL
jgi:TonB family protein